MKLENNKKMLLVIPVYNEEAIIQDSILKLENFFSHNFEGGDFKIVLSDNNSNDNTKQIILDVLGEESNFEYFFTEKQGKGNAIKSVWEMYKNEFDLYVFLDADLATDLDAINSIYQIDNEYDLIIGDRYHKNSIVQRTKKRLLISKIYRTLIKNILKSKISDFPCGFKCVNNKVIENILPLVENDTWFFDSELVYLAEKNGYKIHEIPVNWKDPRAKTDKSKVNILKVSLEYLKEILRIKKHP